MFNCLIDAFFTYIIKLAAKIVFFCIQSIAYEFFFQQLGEVINSRRIMRIMRIIYNIQYTILCVLDPIL